MRTAALRYLAVIPSLVKYDVLHPQKATVLRELAKALDDPKRSVRKEAGEARFVSFVHLTIMSVVLIDYATTGQTGRSYRDVILTIRPLTMCSKGINIQADIH